MDRRTFLKTTTAAGSGLALTTPTLARANDEQIAAPALSPGEIELTFASTWTADVPVLGDAAHRMITRLGQVLDGKCRVVAVGPSDEADLRFGPIPLEQQPAFAFFAGLPGSYGLEPAQLQAWLVAGGGQLLWDDLAAHYGFKPLLAGHTGPKPGLWANRPLRSANDLAGASMAITGLGAAVAHRLGAVPSHLPPAELERALASGRISAVEWGNPLAGLMLGLPEAATHFYTDGIQRSGTAMALGVSLATWERFDTATQIAVENLAARELTASLSESLAHARLAEQAIAANANLAMTSLPQPLVAAIDQTTVALVEEIGASSPDAARVRDSYMAFRSLLMAPHLTV